MVKIKRERLRLSSKTIVGIDPGFGGAIAWIVVDEVQTIRMPVLQIDRSGKHKRELDLSTIVKLFEGLSLNTRLLKLFVYIENVHSMPKQGVSSAFAFGKGFGAILGILTTLKIPYTLISPQQWKKELRVPKGKDAARARASQLLPQGSDQWSLKKDEGRAEAALIAYYGCRCEGV